MPLDGLRAWIGEVERKLGMRTRVFLALGAIAIGIGGAAMYLAIDTRSNAVSESDVRELQEQLEAQIGGGGLRGVGADATQLETELRALQEEVEQLRGNGGGGGQGGGGNGGGAGGGPGGGGAGGGGAGGGGTGAGSGGAGAGGAGELQDLLEQARERSEQLE